MKKFLLLTIAALPLVCSAEQAPAQKKAAKTTVAAAKKGSPAVQQASIPADAVKVGENSYSKTDAQGKTWIYTKTPFGITKIEQGAANQAPAAAQPSGLTAVDAGENVRFSKPSPFGVQTWTRNKNELTEEERAAWDHQKQAQAK